MTISPAQIDSHLALLEKTPVIIQKARDALDDEGLTRQPAPGEWSVLEVLAHLRAYADVFSQTIFTCLVTDWPTLPFIDPREWQNMQDYELLSFDENWQAFQINRRHLLRRLRSLTPDTWERYGFIKTQTRTVYGEMRRMALHEKGHYSQIEVLYKGTE